VFYRHQCNNKQQNIGFPEFFDEIDKTLIFSARGKRMGSPSR